MTQYTSPKQPYEEMLAEYTNVSRSPFYQYLLSAYTKDQATKFFDAYKLMLPKIIEKYAEKYPSNNLEATFAAFYSSLHLARLGLIRGHDAPLLSLLDDSKGKIKDTILKGSKNPAELEHSAAASFVYYGAVAIFLLDTIDAAGRLEEAGELLTEYAEKNIIDPEDNIFPFTYDSYLPIGLVNTLTCILSAMHNKDKMPSSTQPLRPSFKIYAQKQTYKDANKPASEMSLNEIHDTIWSMIDPELITQAMNDFEEDCYAYIGRCNELLQNDAVTFRRIADDWHRQKTIVPTPGGAPFLPNARNGFILDNALLAQLHSIMEPGVFMTQGILPFVTFFATKFLEEDPSTLPQFFSVADPFKACFAFYSMIECGNPVAWSGSLAENVLISALNQLPWAKLCLDDLAEFLCDEKRADDTDLLLAKAKKLLPRFKRLSVYTPAKMSELERTLYTSRMTHSSDSEDPKFHNIQQVIFESDHPLPLRASSQIAKTIYEELTQYIENPKDRAISFSMMISACASAANTLQNTTSPTSLYNPSYVVESEETTYDTPATEKEPLHKDSTAKNEDTSTLIEENRHLRNKIKELEGLIGQLKQTNNDLYKQLSSEPKNAKSSVPCAPLQTIVVKTPEIQLPYTLQHHALICGGHETWVNPFKEKVLGGAYSDRYANPTKEQIANADYIFIQNNCIGHPSYYKIVNIARQLKIPVNYFSFASAEKCAYQIATYDMAFGK